MVKLKSLSVKISSGNKKTGKINAISFPPIKSCSNNIPCTDKCYALKSYRMYPNVKKAWEHNLELLNKDRDLFFKEISFFIVAKSPKYFRWHVSGDIQDQDYLERMKFLANSFPKTKFLAFTKQHSLNFENLPPNLSIIASMWPGWGNPKSTWLPKAWMQDGTETRIPGEAFECSGCCDSCHVCWELKKGLTVWDIILPKH
jgi:hypothetical protein